MHHAGSMDRRLEAAACGSARAAKELIQPATRFEEGNKSVNTSANEGAKHAPAEGHESKEHEGTNRSWVRP